MKKRFVFWQQMYQQVMRKPVLFFENDPPLSTRATPHSIAQVVTPQRAPDIVSSVFIPNLGVAYLPEFCWHFMLKFKSRVCHNNVEGLAASVFCRRIMFT
jgi:hypothetical protein